MTVPKLAIGFREERDTKKRWLSVCIFESSGRRVEYLCTPEQARRISKELSACADEADRHDREVAS